MILFKRIFFLVLLFFSLNIYAEFSRNGGINMCENESLKLILEINRVGLSGKWNSSFYFEGLLRIHVLKDGTITNWGVYTLSSKKFGYPAALRVYNVEDKEKKYIFVFSPPSQPIFKNSIMINVDGLKKNNIFYKKTELLDDDDLLYSRAFSPVKIYKHTFENSSENKISYDFYSEDRDVGSELKFIRLVTYF